MKYLVLALLLTGCSHPAKVICDGMSAPQAAYYSTTTSGSYIVFLIQGDKLIKAHLPVDRCVVIEDK